MHANIHNYPSTCLPISMVELLILSSLSLPLFCLHPLVRMHTLVNMVPAFLVAQLSDCRNCSGNDTRTAILSARL